MREKPRPYDARRVLFAIGLAGALLLPGASLARAQGAQSGTVTGQVLDASTSGGIVGVVVQIDGTRLSADVAFTWFCMVILLCSVTEARSMSHWDRYLNQVCFGPKRTPKSSRRQMLCSE